jgi:FG-GAP-like repeat
MKMRAQSLKFWLWLSITVVASAAWAQAQPGCPAVNFQTAVSANLQPSDSSHIVLLRQSDGSYTGYEMTNQSPYRIIRATPNFQKQLTACLPSHALLPPLPAPSDTGNVPGAPAQSHAVARLSSGNFLVVYPATNVISGNPVALFDHDLNLISQSQLPVPVTSPILVDINGDGRLDVVGVSVSVHPKEGQGTVTLHILLGKADGTFGLGSTYQLAGGTSYSATIAVADLNGDHKPDVVVASQWFFSSGGNISVLLPESGVKTTSSGLERLQPVDLAEYVVDQVS